MYDNLFFINITDFENKKAAGAAFFVLFTLS